MRDVHLRRVLEHSLGTDTHLVVAKFVNYGASIREQSIPTAALALERFQVGVLASTSDWFGAGLLSKVHVAMLLLPSRAVQRHSAASTRMPAGVSVAAYAAFHRGRRPGFDRDFKI